MEKNSPETNPHMYGQLMFGKDAKSTQWGNDAINGFFNKWCW